MRAAQRGAGPVLTLAAAFLLAACSSLYDYEPPAGSSRSAPGPAAGTGASMNGTYIVRPGDTLYSIAWQRGLDPTALAAWNGLANPNRITVGQRLRLTPPAGSATAARAPSSGPAATAATGSVRPPAGGATPPRSTGAPAPPRSTAAPTPVWQWPADGRVVSRFGGDDGLPTGIGISGSFGQDVYAAADGRVTYVGTGLVEYGQLIIISHDDVWLSAYGYNQRLVVAEQEVVRRGQKIAEMGPGPGRQPRLHFEIRRYGEPVDPMPLLPGSR